MLLMKLISTLVHDKWFADMANDEKAIYGTGAGGWFQNEGEKEIFLIFILSKLYQIMIKRRKCFKVNAVDMPKEPKEDSGMIIRHIQLYHYAIGQFGGDTLPEFLYSKKGLISIRCWTYNLFYAL
jgi:hypothetical protein